MQLSSISLAITRLGAMPWTPATLFAAAEVGVWYDPSDLTSMFQDSAGATAAAIESPVGLILDKSKGLVLGAELVTNGDMSSATGWSGDSTAAITGGVLNVGAMTGNTVTQGCLTVGKWYKLVFSVTRFATLGTFRVRLGGGGAGDIVPGITGVGTYTVYGRASVDTAFALLRYATSDFDIDNISVRELPGHHATQATAAARGTLKATGVVEWIDYDGVDDVHNTTFPVSLGTACTVARANVGGAPTILTAQTIGTSYASSTDHAGLIIVNRALTASETASLTAYLTAKGAS